MADIKVEDLMRSIRERALEGAAKQSDPSCSLVDSTAKPLSRLQTSLTITGRTHDQLPPVTTYRRGLLARVELWIKRQLKRATKANLEARLTELESRLALFESRFDELLAEKLAEIRIEHRKDNELLLNEQRVCFKQLALEISEAGVVADRAKRSIQLRLAELAARVDEMRTDQHEVNTVGHEITDNPDLR